MKGRRDRPKGDNRLIAGVEPGPVGWGLWGNSQVVKNRREPSKGGQNRGVTLNLAEIWKKGKKRSRSGGTVSGW